MLNRDIVFWCGGEPTDAEIAEFTNRGLSIKRLNGIDNWNFTYGRGLVFSARPPGLAAVRGQLGRIVDALDNGLIVYLLADDDTTHAYLESHLPGEIQGSKFVSQIRRRTGAIPPHECAEMIARHSPGVALNTALEINHSSDVELSDQHLFLLRRAFSDCKAIALKPLSGGRSASTFEVRATLSFSEVGPRPMPFFVKLDDADKIKQERQCYELFATQHIPWSLRPNLDPSRCIIGVREGILVGSFVDHSESLWEAIQKGRGPRLIESLFEDTLMGWRSQAYRKPPFYSRLADALPDVFKYDKVLCEHVTKAAEFGSPRNPQDLWEDLLSLPKVPLRNAPMHGDMHGENVRVRDNDAIIIDLAKTKNGPLSADLASLDVWISFEIPAGGVDRTVWLSVVRELYSPIAFAALPNNETVDVGLDWLRGSVRKIRMHSSSVCESPTEYQTAIALYLLRRACYPSRSDEDGYRRAVAYCLGSELVTHLTNSLSRVAA